MASALAILRWNRPWTKYDVAENGSKVIFRLHDVVEWLAAAHPFSRSHVKRTTYSEMSGISGSSISSTFGIPPWCSKLTTDCMLPATVELLTSIARAARMGVWTVGITLTTSGSRRRSSNSGEIGGPKLIRSDNIFQELKRSLRVSPELSGWSGWRLSKSPPSPHRGATLDCSAFRLSGDFSHSSLEHRRSSFVTPCARGKAALMGGVFNDSVEVSAV